MKVKTLIIDDEPSARSRVRKLLSVYPDVEIVGEAVDGLEALERVDEVRPDLLLLDVQMPGLSGFEVLRAIPATRMPLVIFATAYDEYALAAFAANAVGYLLKPIKRVHLDQALERVSRLLLSEADISEERERLGRVVKGVAPLTKQIAARRGDRFVLLGLDQIFFFRVENGLLRAKAGTESYWTNYRISELESLLPSPPFYRVHRGAIVNLWRVKEIIPFLRSTYLLVINDLNGTRIQVSERRSKKLRELFRI